MNYNNLTWSQYDAMLWDDYLGLNWDYPGVAPAIPRIMRSATLEGLGLGI